MFTRGKKAVVNRIFAMFLAAVMVVSVMMDSAMIVFATEVNNYVLTVLETDGETAVSGAMVTITAEEFSESTETDESGTAGFLLTEGVNYQYTVEKTGYESAEGTVDFANGNAVELTRKVTAEIDGIVKNTEGELLSGVTVKVSGYSDCETVVTDENGEFQVPDAYEGEEYIITATLDGYKKQTIDAVFAESNEIILEAKQTINLVFEKEEVKIPYGETANNAIIYDGALTVTYSSANEAIATVDQDGTVTPIAPGETTITAAVEESEDYLAAEAEYKVIVKAGVQEELRWSNTVPQSISWKKTFINSAVGGSGEGAITYKSSDEEIATVDNTGLVTFSKPSGEAGVTITATKSGEGIYENAEISYIIVVTKAEQEALVFENPQPNAIYYGDTFSNVATGGSIADAIVQYTSKNPEVADVKEDGSLEIKKAGEVTIAATIDENESYNSVSAEYTLTIYKSEQKADFLFEKGNANQTIQYRDPETEELENKYINAASGGENKTITYSSSDDTIAAVDESGRITTYKTGEVIITAVNAADDRYEEKKISYKLIIEKADQIVAFEKTEIPVMVYGGEAFENKASAKTEVSYSTSDKSIAVVDGEGKVTALKAGEVTIIATASSGDADVYNGATAEYELTIKKAEQVISFENGMAPVISFNDNENIYENAATSNGVNDTEPESAGISPITFTYSVEAGNNLVTVNEKNDGFTILGAGKVTIKAIATENERYNKAEASYTLTINKAKQEIAFPKPEYEMISGTDFDEDTNPSPKASVISEKSNEEAIVYSCKDDNKIIQELNDETGALVLTNEIGTVTICATKLGDVNYEEATAEYTLAVKGWVPAEELVCYSLQGDTIDDKSGWFTGEVSLLASEGYEISYDNGKEENEQHGAGWVASFDKVVTEDTAGTDIQFYVREIATGYITDLNTVTVQKDTVNPTAEITAEKLSGWEKWLSIITFGTWGKETVDFKIEKADSTSKVATVEYCIVEDDTELLTHTALDNLGEWETYNDEKGVSIGKNTIAVVYAKVTDTAGHYVYASTNGVVFDGTVPEISDVNIITEPNENDGVYYGDVTVSVLTKDAAPASGIKSVEYWIECDGKITTGENKVSLFEFDIENPTQKQLVTDWDSVANDKNIVIDSVVNNSDNVKLHILVTDNAGNKSEVTKELRICSSTPTMDITFRDDPEIKNTFEGVNYYDAARTARVVITGRTSIFEANPPIIDVTATDFAGKELKEKTYEISEWTTVESPDGDKDKATHTAYVTFNPSANYELDVVYTNKEASTDAGFEVKQSVEKFVVDTDKPTGEVKIAENKWSKLIETLTFHLWKNTEVNVTVLNETDVTSPIKSVEYYKYNGENVLTNTELEAAEWKSIDQFPNPIEKDERFTVYLKITDYAEQYDFISSDGYIVDMTDSSVVLTPSKTNENGYYNAGSDIKIQINVEDKLSVTDENATPAGIRTIEYWVTCDEKETQRKVLYNFDYAVDSNGTTGTLKITDWSTGEMVESTTEGVALTTDKLLHAWSGIVDVDNGLNNSDNVKVCLQVTDNAGNISLNYLPLKIDATKPAIQIFYDDNEPYTHVLAEGEKETLGKGYFGDTRTATIAITERTSTFNETKAAEGIVITAKSGTDDGEKEIVLDRSKMITGVWQTTEGTTPDEAVHTTTVVFEAEGNYDFTVSYTDEAGNTCTYEEVTFKEGTVAGKNFAVDRTRPTAQVVISQNVWSKLLEKLTFGLWSNEKFEITANAWDVMSPQLIEYYISQDAVQLSENDLKGLEDSQWTKFKDFNIDNMENMRFAVYLRVTDYAGNRLFINSDGHVFDKKQANITITPEESNANGIYNKDVKVKIDVAEEGEIYSGIKTVEYWVTKDGEKTQSETLYNYEYTRDSGENSNGGNLKITEWFVAASQTQQKSGKVPAWAELTAAFSKEITVEAEKNNSCDVIVYVKVTDNAGNVTESNVSLDIDISAPEIGVTYDNNSPYKIADRKTEEVSYENGYFPAARTATVVVTERTEHFDAEAATNGIKISAKNAKGETVIEDCKTIIGKWVTVEPTTEELEKKLKTKDDATHTATIAYEADANYFFEISYTDKADNVNVPVDYKDSVTPVSFTIDKTKPTGTVTVKNPNVWEEMWDKLIDAFGFGLWSQNTVSVSGTTDDITSPIESVSYIKVADTEPMTEEKLIAVKDWTTFNGFDVPANEQFTVYLRIVDYAGNVSYISTNGVIVDNVSPKLSIDAPSGIHDGDVSVSVRVIDPLTGGTYSGIKSLSYQVLNMGDITQSDTLFDFDAVNPQQSELVQEVEETITVDCELNNSNEIVVVFEAQDNAGNTVRDSVDVMIDVTSPKIAVSYDNNEAVNEDYFKTDRTATIVITERNFDPDDVVITITNTENVIPTVSEWDRSGGGGNDDDTDWTATLTYAADGDYTFDIAFEDLAGNPAEDVEYGDNVAPTKFTIDKTLPVISVGYADGASGVANDRYFREARTATIRIEEHNFDVENVDIRKTDATSKDIPNVTWIHNGDVHTATIVYSEDGDYTFDISVVDKAANENETIYYGNSIAAQRFTVDKGIESLKVEGVTSKAYKLKQEVKPVITFKDINYQSYSVELYRTNMSEINKDVTADFKFVVSEVDAQGNGTITFDALAERAENDGIYTLKVDLVDKAGNTNPIEIKFTLNRYGSVYEYKGILPELIKDGGAYKKNIEEDLIIMEYNADEVLKGSQKVEITRDGKPLENVACDVKQITSDGWFQYQYTISKDYFTADGVYKVFVSSKDDTGNTPENSNYEDMNIQFHVDKTAPEITSIIGLEESIINAPEMVVKYTVFDAMGLKSVKVMVDGKQYGEIITEFEDLNNYSGEFTISEKRTAQKVQIVVEDLAENSTDTDSKDFTSAYVFSNSVTVSTNFFVRWYANKPLFWGITGGAGALAVALGTVTTVIRRKKSVAGK